MDFKTTSTRAFTKAACSGFTIVETLFAAGITVLCLTTLSLFCLFTSHSFATLFRHDFCQHPGEPRVVIHEQA